MTRFIFRTPLTFKSFFNSNSVLYSVWVWTPEKVFRLCPNVLCLSWTPWHRLSRKSCLRFCPCESTIVTWQQTDWRKERLFRGQRRILLLALSRLLSSVRTVFGLNVKVKKNILNMFSIFTILIKTAWCQGKFEQNIIFSVSKISSWPYQKFLLAFRQQHFHLKVSSTGFYLNEISQRRSKTINDNFDEEPRKKSFFPLKISNTHFFARIVLLLSFFPSGTNCNYVAPHRLQRHKWILLGAKDVGIESFSCKPPTFRNTWLSNYMNGNIKK